MLTILRSVELASATHRPKRTANSRVSCSLARFGGAALAVVIAVAVPGAVGAQSCITDADCADPTRPECDNGTCVAECGTDADCTDPSRPSCIAGACTATPTVCTTDSDCQDPVRPFCSAGSCVASPGACTTDADCVDPAQPFCAAGFCSAGSGVTDHLMCFGIRDSARIKAELQIDTPVFGSFDCKIAKKSIELCVPGESTPGPALDVSTKPAAPIHPVPVGGAPAAASYLCYKLTCDKPFPTEQAVADRYGIRTVDKLKVRRVCVPAEAFTEF